MQSEIRSNILAFAAHLDDPATDAELKAKARLWIDGAGNPTSDGAALVEALIEQGGTRTAFRSVL